MHLSAAWPETVERGVEVDGLDLVMADADIYGRSVASLRGELTGWERVQLCSLANRLEFAISALPEDAREYFDGLVKLARIAGEFPSRRGTRPLSALSPLQTLSTGGGFATAGEIAGRAVLAVPLDARLWEVHDKPWDASGEDECEDSYWPPDDRTAGEWSKWGVIWMQPSDLIEFVETYWPEFDAESITAKRLPAT